jgi:tetratricopeptide (TPR) repeat protein
MRPQLTLSLIANLQREPLIALIHQELIAGVPLVSDAEALAAMYEVGWQEYDNDHRETALESFQTVLIVAQQQQDQAYMAGALNAIAWILDHNEIEPSPGEPTPILSAPSPQPNATEHELLSDLLALANYHHTTDDWQQALDLYQQALELANCHQALTEMGLCLNGLGLIYLSLRNFDRAQTYTQTAVAIFEETSDRVFLAAATHNLGVALYWQHHYEAAIQAFSQSQQLRHQMADILGEAITLDYMGRAFASQQEYMFALSCYQAALECYSEMTDYDGIEMQIAILQGHIAILCEQTHHQELAISHYLDALETFQSNAEYSSATLMQHRLARLHETSGRTTMALYYYEQAWGNVKTPDELAAIVDQVDVHYCVE